jgi:hypothetical protein
MVEFSWWVVKDIVICTANNTSEEELREIGGISRNKGDCFFAAAHD